MGYEMYLVRDDNRTLVELGKTTAGLHVPLQELQDQQTGTFVIGDDDVDPLAEFLLDGVLEHGHWEPGDYRSYAGQFAWRLNRWAGGKPVRVAGETEVTNLVIRDEDLYVTTDSRYETEWLYYDVFMHIDRKVQEQIDSCLPPPSTFPAVVNLRKFTSDDFTGLKNRSVSRGNPDRTEGEPVFVKVSLREMQEDFLDELQKLEPFTKNEACGFWGCPDDVAHDHGPRDTGPSELRFCGCSCHDGAKIFCSCFGPCCHENHVPRAQQTPRPPVKPIKVGDFTTFTMPVVRSGYPKLMP